MPKSPFPNYLRTIRKRSGLSQDEVAFLLGSPSGGIVSRYERFNRLPSVETACAYEALFGNPVRELFAGVFQKSSAKLAKRAQLLARKLEGGAPEGAMARKLRVLPASVLDFSRQEPELHFLQTNRQGTGLSRIRYRIFSE